MKGIDHVYQAVRRHSPGRRWKPVAARRPNQRLSPPKTEQSHRPRTTAPASQCHPACRCSSVRARGRRIAGAGVLARHDGLAKFVVRAAAHDQPRTIEETTYGDIRRRRSRHDRPLRPCPRRGRLADRRPARTRSSRPDRRLRGSAGAEGSDGLRRRGQESSDVELPVPDGLPRYRVWPTGGAASTRTTRLAPPWSGPRPGVRRG
jgi:hypothetical protein